MRREEGTMARRIPKVHEGSLQQQSKEGTSTDTISIGTAEWYSWLEHYHAFTFETPLMTFTARKEQRPSGWSGMPTDAGKASCTVLTLASQRN